VNERVNGSSPAPRPPRTVSLHPTAASSSRSGLDGAGGEGTLGGMQGGSAPPGGLTSRISSMEILVTARKVDHTTHYAEMRQAIFCLCPIGWAQWTVRFYESIQMGCVPVTFHPAPSPMPLRMPFERAIDYTTLSINVPPNQISELRPRLEAIVSNRTRLRDMQRALWQARPAFDWTDLSQAGAFYHTLEQLATKLAHPAGAAERDRALSLRNKPMGR